jgi:hypothetical protein
MELIISILCNNNDDNITYENNTKIYMLVVILLLCKRSKLTSCNIPYEGAPLAALLETIILDILLLDLAKSSITLKAAFSVVGVPQMCGDLIHHMAEEIRCTRRPRWFDFERKNN